MKLKLTKTIDYFVAFSRLDGYQRCVEIRGNPQIIVESYDLSPKVKARCITNRHLLRPHKEMFEEEKKKEEKALRDFMLELDSKLTDAERDKLVGAQEKKSNDRLEALADQEVDVPGLQKLPGSGIRLRAKDPGLIGILDLLMDEFIEGELDYGQPKTEPKKPADPPDE